VKNPDFYINTDKKSGTQLGCDFQNVICSFLLLSDSVADPDPGSGIGCLFDPWIRDPGWEKVSIRIRDEQPGSYIF
jgi:hypothetical protein